MKNGIRSVLAAAGMVAALGAQAQGRGVEIGVEQTLTPCRLCLEKGVPQQIRQVLRMHFELEFGFLRQGDTR